MFREATSATAPLLLVLLAGCSAPVASTGRASEAIVDGALDSVTRGVVSLATVMSSGEVAYCTGELIAPNLVLTARHCISLLNQEAIDCATTQFTTVAPADTVFASAAVTRPSNPSFFYRAQSVAVPPSFAFCGNDIALITLSTPMPSAIELIVPRIDLPASRGEVFAAIGFGLTVPDGATGEGTRMRAEGNHVACMGLDCLVGGDLIRATEWSSLDVPTCPGDSGGPALDSLGRVFGLDSRGPAICKGAIYTDVSSWRDFIIQGALDAANVGGYAAPFWTAGMSTVPSPPVEAGTSDAGDAGLLGESCTSAAQCGPDMSCFTESGSPPGICVSQCSAALPSCPSGYGCASSIGACVPNGSSLLRTKGDDGGCRVASLGSARGASKSLVGAGYALGLSAIATGRARRRRRTRLSLCSAPFRRRGS